MKNRDASFVSMTMRSLVVKVNDEELAKLHALANDVREPISVIVRRWLRDSYRARFGDAVPPDVELKHGGRLSVSK